MTARIIGVIGGYGAVGRSAVTHLARWGHTDLVVAGRHPRETGDVPAERLDVEDPGALAAFCSRCRVVVNCAGPSYRFGERVARAAWEAGADYVDAGGDDPLQARLSAGNASGELVAVLSAGMLPGLTGLLPRLGADDLDHVEGVMAYAGGLDRFTPAAAADYAASLRNGFGHSRAAWRNGRRVELAMAPSLRLELPFFGGTIAAYPYLSTEMERVAAQLQLDNLSFYNVFAGTQLQATIGRLDLAGGDNAAIAGQLVEASALDAFGRRCYQCLLYQFDGVRRGLPDSRTVVLSAESASGLTGTMVALATSAVNARTVPAGVHFAADVLDPHESLWRLQDSPAVTAIEVLAGPIPGPDEREEGAL